MLERAVRKQVNVQGVVLAGVHAWGNCFLEHAMPRPLIPMVDRPLVVYPLSWLRDGGIGSASICANSDTAFLRRRLGNGAECVISLDYYEDTMPRGPAGCVRDAVIQSGYSTFVVIEATTVPRISLSDLLEAHRTSEAALTVVVHDRSNEEAYSAGFQEPTGIYVFSLSALNQVPTTGYQDIKETLIPRLYASGQRVVKYSVQANAAPRITDAASYLAVSRWLVELISAEDTLPRGYLRCGEARIHESVRIHESARLVGPVLIEPGCLISADSVIVGPTTIGAGCMIGQKAVVSRSSLWQECRVSASAVVDHCVMTSYSAVSAQQRLNNAVCLPGREPRPLWWRRLLENFSADGDRQKLTHPVPASSDSYLPISAPAWEEHLVPARCLSTSRQPPGPLAGRS